MEQSTNSVEDRPNTSLNKKRVQKTEEGQQNQSYNKFLKEKPQTQQGSRKKFQQNFEQRGQSSSSQFRAVNMTQSFYNQAQKDLGFNAPLSNKQEFSKTNSSTFKGQSSFYGGPFSSKDYSKIIPKNIMYDKELLYDELLKTKSTQNLLAKENNSLKTRLSGIQEEIQRLCKKEQQNPYEMESNKYKQVFKDSMFSSQLLNKSSSATLIFNLKKQITELQTENQQKEQAFQKLQRAVKLTSIKELEVQLKMYSEECMRLRRMLEQQMKLDRDERFKNETTHTEGTPRESSANYNQAFQLLKSDNIQMAANLKKMEEETFANRIVIETLEKQLRNQKHENQQLKRVILEKDREIESFKGNDPFVGSGKKNSQFTVEGQLKIEIDKKNSEISLLSHSIQQKDKRIMDVEKKSREKEADLMDKITSEIKEKQEIQNLLDKERDIIFKLRQDIERLQVDRRFTKVDMMSSQVTMNEIDGFQSNEQTNSNSRQLAFNRKSVRTNTNISLRSQQTQQEQGQIANYSRKRLPRVSSDEITQIGEDLKYKLKLQRVSLNQLEKYLFKEETLRSQDINLQDIYQAIQEYPFKITDENQLMSLSRYLIEDNSQDWVNFDPNATNKISVVKSVLRHLLDNYTIPSQQQEIKDMVKVTQSLNKSKGSIIDMLQRDPLSKKINGTLCCDKKQFLNVLDQLEIQLAAHEMEVMLVKLYEDCLNLNQIKIDSIFRIFNQDRFNSTTEISMRDILDNPVQQNAYNFNKQPNNQTQYSDQHKQDSKQSNSRKESIKGESGKGQINNKSKAFKNVVENDFNAYNSTVDQEAVAANQNNYQLDDGEEEVESQGEVSNDEDQYQQQHVQQSQRNNVSRNNNQTHEHELLQQVEQTNYTQQTNSQFQNDPNDLYQESGDE